MDLATSNYIRLVVDVVLPGTRAVRSYFNTCFPPNQLNLQLTTVLLRKLQKLKQKKAINISQWNLLFPSKGDVSSENFDVPLMICLLRHFHIKKQPVNGFDQLPPDHDQSPADDLARIKYYRNYVAHSCDGRVSDGEFTIIRNNLCGAIERLGGSSLTEQCNTSLAREMAEKSVGHMSEDKRNPIPHNIRDMHTRQIKTWIEDDTKYIPIKATEVVLKLVERDDCVTVVGNGGTGKTALIRHVAIVLMRQGYEVVPVNSPSKIEKFYNKNAKQVFVFDDPCGIYSIDHRKRIKWKDNSDIIKTNLKLSKAKLLISVRLAISRDKHFQNIDLLNQNIVNLDEQEYRLSEQDRGNIFKSYFGMTYDKFGVSDESVIAHKQFPLLCRLAAKNEIKDFNLDKYFRAPEEFFKNEIKLLQTESPLSYCVLVLCTLFNGRLPKSVLSNSNASATIVENCYETCGINRGKSRIKMLDNVCSLENVYLRFDDNYIVFEHDIIMDIVAKYIANEFPTLVLTDATLEFIRDRVKLAFEANQEFETHSVLLDKQYHTLFFDRLYQAIKSGESYFVFNHSQIRSSQFQNAFSEYLETKEPSELQSTFFCEKTTTNYRHILNLIDICILFLENKPVKLDLHNILQCFVNDPLDWTLGTGLHIIFRALCRRLGQVIKDKIINKIVCYRYLIVFSGSVELYTWYLNTFVKKLKKYKCEDYLKMDFLLTISAGHQELLLFLLKTNPLAKTMKDDQFHYRLNVLIKVMSGLSLKEAKNNTILDMLDLRNMIDWEKPLDALKRLMEYTCDDWLTEDPQVNKILISKFESRFLPLLNLKIEQIQMICDTMKHTPTINEVLRCQWDTRKSYLEIASMFGHSSVVKSLLRTTDANYTCKQTNILSKHFSSFPIVVAAMFGQTEIVDILIQNGASKNSCSESGCSSLVLASKYGHLDTVAVLLEKGVSVNLQNVLGNTAFICASQKGHTEIVSLLLHYGADPNLKSIYGTTALMEASENGHCKIVEHLLNKNAFVNTVDIKGFSALIKAAQVNFYRIVNTLISISYKMYSGIQPLSVLRKKDIQK